MEGQDYAENLRVASFSAYLNSTDDNSFLLKLTGAVQDPISPEVTPRLKTTLVRSCKADQEGEIGVFGADKYFNMKMDYYQAPKVVIDHTSQTKITEQEKPSLMKAETPSVCSEVSWNSQTTLLPNLERNPPRIKPKKGIGKGFFSGFGCNGPCLDKKSVSSVECGMVQRKDARKESFRFPNPIPVSLVENLTVGKQFGVSKAEEVPRYSIEVFGSQQTAKKGDIATNLERKLSMLTWDAIPKSKNLPSSTLGSGTGPIDDIQSDASSDLFEIETLSGPGSITGHFPLLIPSPENCAYEPSEASIEWSVVTASALDYDEKSIIGGETNFSMNGNSKTAKTKNVVRREDQKGRAGGILGCKSHKSVSIDETAVRVNENKVKPMTIGKSQGHHSMRKDFEFATVQRTFSSREMSP